MDAKKLHTRTLGWLAVVVILSLLVSGYTALGTGNTTGAETGPAVALRAASGERTTFKEHDGPAGQSGSRKGREVPHLVLRRNGALTEARERTLTVAVEGIRVPAPGVTVTLHVETQHKDPDPPEAASPSPETAKVARRIPVWQEAQWIANESLGTSIDAEVVFRHTFTETVSSGSETIATPTDYFRYDITVSTAEASNPNGAASFHLSQDHAFLMENQHIAQLPEVLEATEGAAPDELIVYYLDMVPFRKNELDPATWLPRGSVPDYVSGELVPRMVEAFRVQTNAWGFPWHGAWTSYRRGEDAERLSVALSDGRTWFHGKAPQKAHSAISIRVAGGDNDLYDTLTDGLLNSFHHELFHNLQRSIQRNEGGQGPLAGAGGVWAFFSEGMSVLASSVGQPELQFRWSRAYVSRANGFLGRSGRQVDDLNTSYATMSPYRSAIYWRFLYERCGQTGDGGIDPAVGMEVVRRALTLLYAGDVVDSSTSTDLVGAVPEIMDRALEASPCPFDTYAESLTAFARAVYGLGLEDGQPEAAASPGRWGFHDPHNVYRDPPVTTIAQSGTDTRHTGEIPSSFGIDLIEVTLDPAVNGQPLALELHTVPGAAASFAVQAWTADAAMRAPDSSASAPEDAQVILTTRQLGGKLTHVIPAVDAIRLSKLGLIVTRIDANERLDPVGEYTIILRSPGLDPLLTERGSP